MSAQWPGIDPVEFVARVRPLLERRDAQGLVRTIHRHWTLVQVASLLDGAHADARKVAALSLSLIGTAACLEALARQLAAPDPVANQMAEHAMWSIWFRGGNEQANAHVVRGAHAFARKDVAGAIRQFTRALEADPTHAEAHHQRAMAYFMLEDYDASLRDCARAAELMPLHFGAWSGLGHCHAHMGRVDEAVRCYRRAMAIHPNLACIAELVEELEGGGDAAG